MTKKCKECRAEKSFSDFNVAYQGATKVVYRAYCKPCQTVIATKYNREQKDIRRSATLKHEHGITLKEYNEILKGQNGVCAICKNPETANTSQNKSRIRNLAVDHDHKTDKNRGLLCTRCNQGIGNLKENIKTLENAIKYLKYWNKQ